MDSPLCFVLMPFGKKADPTGKPDIDFDRIYERSIKPAIEAAGLSPIRADEEKTGGIIHKAMFERLMLCEYAIADLTTANANVFYELGVRHTARPKTTLPIFAESRPVPFDVNFLRALPYVLGEQNEFSDTHAKQLRDALTQKLADCRDSNHHADTIDSPLFQLIGSEWKPDIARIKTDIFRKQVQINEQFKRELTEARTKGRAGIAQLEGIKSRLGDLDRHESGILVDLMLSYRALKAWDEMIALQQEMPVTLQRQVMVKEQLAFALNRRSVEQNRPADQSEALKILTEVEQDQGPSSETCGLLGRIYKDRWDALKETSPFEAKGNLKKAIETYRRGYESDWRDAYPGINLVTLLDIEGSTQSIEDQHKVLPVVKYAVDRRLTAVTPDYWDYATLLELAVLASDEQEALARLTESLSAAREAFEPETTARNLGLIDVARRGRKEELPWLGDFIEALNNKSLSLLQ